MGINFTGTFFSALGAAIGEPSARAAAGHRLHLVGSAIPDSTLKVVVVEKAEELQDHAAAWQDLADHAMECNAFYEPCVLMRGIKPLGRGKSRRGIFSSKSMRTDPALTARLQG